MGTFCCKGAKPDTSNQPVSQPKDGGKSNRSNKVEAEQFKTDAKPNLNTTSSIGRSDQEIKIRIIQAKNLAAMDAIKGKSDPYVRVTVNNNTYCTRKKQNTLEPVWNEDIVVNGPTLLDSVNTITFDVLDWGMYM